MSQHTKTVATLVVALFLLGCQSSQDTGRRSDVDLAGTSWSLLGLEHEEDTLSTLGDYSPPEIEFDDEGRVSGFSGVNRFNSSCTTTPEGGFTLGPIASTRMAGTPEVMKLETDFLAVIGAATSYRITEGQLVLSGPGGMARFQPQ